MPTTNRERPYHEDETFILQRGPDGKLLTTTPPAGSSRRVLISGYERCLADIALPLALRYCAEGRMVTRDIRDAALALAGIDLTDVLGLQLERSLGRKPLPTTSEGWVNRAKRLATALAPQARGLN